MDTLEVEFFEFEQGATPQQIRDVWISRELWFFNIEKKEQLLYKVQLSNGQFLKGEFGRDSIYSSENEAHESCVKKQLTHYSIVVVNRVFYTACNDYGRYILNASGQPVEFESETNATRMAISYNNDLVKIRLAFSMFETKKENFQEKLIEHN